jgi:hypothetical protein
MPLPVFPAPDPDGRLAGTPALRHDGQWWLTSPAGAVPADQALAQELDRFATALDAAHRAVAQVRPPEAESQ